MFTLHKRNTSKKKEIVTAKPAENISKVGRRHVVIVGAGAAGMACAATLINHPEKFRVTVLEAKDVVGGQASSIAIDEKRFGASWMNNGVQGGSKIFQHTFKFFRQYGFFPHEVNLEVAFGKGEDGFWTNCFPSKLVEKHASDIKRFGLVLKFTKWTMPVFGIIPISLMLRTFHLSDEFANKMVYPLIALFLGTGNQTPHVPAALVERLFGDPNMKLWDYNSATLLPNRPTMYTLCNLHDFYTAWKDDLVDQGVTVRTKTEVLKVVYRSDRGVRLQVYDMNTGTVSGESFDDLVLCVQADDALRILGKTASRREQLVLGGATYYDDVTVTHTDEEYFNKRYETQFKPELCIDPKSEDERQRVAASKSIGFRPMYYTYSYKHDPRLIEMSFNCSNYQHQLRHKSTTASTSSEPIYQTIFLDRKLRHRWTINDISPRKIIKSDWWHQVGHRWQHYVRVVPGMMFIQNRRSTLFAGSWTLVNMHELACVSGIAAAYRLGADYAKFDDFAQDLFAKYLLVSHGVVFSWEEKRRRKKK